MSLTDRLAQRVRERRPVSVGVVGAGQMGQGLVVQLERLPWARVAAVADLAIERAQAALAAAGRAAEEVASAGDVPGAARALEAGRRVVTPDAELLAELPGLEVVVDATGVPEVGARVARSAIGAGRHVVMLNVEADVTVGRALSRLARRAGVVYTASAGDEYAATKELVDFAGVLGFEVVAAGKGKNNPLDRAATPTALEPRAAALGANPRMLASFVDGTKTAVEMTCLANATGLEPDVPGMHGPIGGLDDLPALFRPREEGGILARTGVVDYAIGVAPGVFVVFTTDHEVIARDLRYLKLGSGPYWTLYRPYHLANLETPISVARAAVCGEPTIAPLDRPVAESIAVAKRDLRPGERLDGIGGFTYYGSIERAADAAAGDHLPLGLAEGAVVASPVRAGEPIVRAAVEVDESTELARLRRQQDAQAPTAVD
jgi:predicted homoserine dehydrogenase-like protein